MVPQSNVLVVHIARYGYNEATRQTTVDYRQVPVPKVLRLRVSYDRRGGG